MSRSGAPICLPTGPGCLRARGVTFSYDAAEAGGGRAIIHGLDLDIAAGEFVGILGPNGAGKTTLLRIMAGALRPQGGTVELFGRPMDSLRPAERARLMAFVPQESRPGFDFSVLGLVLMGRAPHLGLLGIEGKADLEIARQALAFTGASALAERAFSTLSTGEKQRVVLARALAQQALVFLLDEPTAFLDLGHQVRIYELLARLREETGATIIVASHDLNLAGRYCNRLVLLRPGEVVADGAAEAVLTEERIRDVYGVRARVWLDPEAGPVVIPFAGRDAPGTVEPRPRR